MSIDFSKANTIEIERMALASKYDESQLKKAGFDENIQRAREHLKKVDDPQRREAIEKFIRYALEAYNKYAGTHHKN